MDKEQLNERLAIAVCKEGDYDKAEELLQKCADPFAISDRISQILGIGSWHVVDYVRQGEGREYRRFESILYSAVNKDSLVWQAIEPAENEPCNIKALKKAIKNGDDVLRKNIYGHLPIECAAINGDYEAVLLLAKEMLRKEKHMKEAA